MKKGEMPQLSAKWWKSNRAKTLKDVGLEAALDKYERAELFLRSSENDLAYKAVIESLKALAPTVTKQIAACTKGIHTDTIEALKRYDPLIKQTWAEVHRDSAKFKDRIAQVQEMFDKGKLAIEAEVKKAEAAQVEADRLIKNFPAACKKGKGLKAQDDLRKHAKVLEKLSEKLGDLDAMLANLKKLQKQLRVDGEVRGNPLALDLLQTEALRDCEAKQAQIHKTLGEYSEAELRGLNEAYTKKLKQFTQVAVRHLGDANSLLGAVRAEIKPPDKIAKLVDEKAIAKIVSDMGVHEEAAKNLRTQINATARDMREFDDDGDTPESKAFAAAQAKLPTVLEKLKQVEDQCKDYKRALEERTAELRRLQAESKRKQEIEAQRDAEAQKDAEKYKKLTERFVAKTKAWTTKAKEFEADVKDLVRRGDADGAVALIPNVRNHRESAALDRNAAGEIVNIELPNSKLKQKQLAHHHLIFSKVTKELDSVYLKLDEMMVELRKIPGVLGRA